MPHPRPISPRDSVLLALAAAYGLWLAAAYDWHFVDGANLLFHEAGHVFLSPFGQTLQMLGGTLGQLAMPGLVMLHLAREGRVVEMWLGGIWLGENLLNVARYMADAEALALPLVGGEIHDWNWLLSRLGLLEHCTGLARLVHALGLALVLGAWLAALRASRGSAQAPLDPRAHAVCVPLPPRDSAARS